jgi:hypothetical protein
MNSDYKCIEDCSSKCECGENVFLLYNSKTQSNLPRFYICFKCGFIGESGVGVVRKGIKKIKKYGKSGSGIIR